jgi:FtsZ-binding cell division protein ZapB
LKEEIATVKSKCLRLTLDNEKLNYTLKMKVENLTKMSNKISFLSNENKLLKMDFEKLSGENKSLLESLQERSAEIEQLKTELSSLKMVSFLFPSIF